MTRCGSLEKCVVYKRQRHELRHCREMDEKENNGGEQGTLFEKNLPSSNLPSAWTLCPLQQHKDRDKHRQIHYASLQGCGQWVESM